MREAYQKAAEAILAAQRVVIASHINPDGDALGSILALVHVLRALGKEVIPISADGVPDIYRWLPGAEDVQTGTERRDFDLAIVCDAGALNRVGTSVMPIVESAPHLMDIDHHVADGTFGDLQILDASAAATAELIFTLLQEVSVQAGRDLLSTEIANCLMTGIVTDTGAFRYPNVTPTTFRIAASLQEQGAKPAMIAELSFDKRSFASLKLLGRALDSLQTTPDGRIAWAHVTAQDMEELNGTDTDTEGIVSHVRAVQSAMIGVLFREIPGKKIRISLRAREGADVNKIANVFGGGGHKLAAGCSFDPPLADAEAVVIAEAARQLATEIA